MQLRFMVKFKLCYATFFVAAPCLQGKTHEHKKMFLEKEGLKPKKTEIGIRYNTNRTCVYLCNVSSTAPLSKLSKLARFLKERLGAFSVSCSALTHFATFFVSSLDWRFNSVLILSTTIFYKISCGLYTTYFNFSQT
jgi:hypothetical protein